MNGDAQDQAEKAYTISLPGLTDIIRIPALDDPGAAQRRAVRMATSNTPLPQKLQWIPTWINHLDDAQDMIITGLTLAKPLLRKLPARFIPGLGWVLLANDILNLGVGVLGAVTTGPRPKALARDLIQTLGGNRLRRLNNAKLWLAKTHWFGFALQAGQVLQNLTGYGLALGGIMGAITDAVWAGVRVAQGKQVRIVAPPPQDPLGKAYRLIHQGWTIPFLTTEIEPQDQLMLYAAHSIAQQLANDAGGSDILDVRAPILADTEVAVYEPWNPVSRAACEAVGAKPTGILRNACLQTIANPTYQKATADLYLTAFNFQLQRANYLGKTNKATVMQMLHDQAGAMALDTIAGMPGATTGFEELTHWTFYKMVEYGVYPPDGSDKALFEDLVLNMEFINELGRTRPTLEDMIAGMNMTFGGWQSTPGNYF